MNLNHPSVNMIEVVAEALGELKDEVVFVGGSTLALYLDDEGAQQPRPTEDVDCVIELANYGAYSKLETKLRAKGFQNCIEGPVCRWIIKRVIVDVMPTDPKILGFSNRWYKEGMENSVQAILPSGRNIRIFSQPYFVAAKIEAYIGRGQNDFRTSHDIEDMVTLLDGITSFDQFSDAPVSVKTHLQEKFQEYLKEDLFLESISGHLEQGSGNAERSKRILDWMERY